MRRLFYLIFVNLLVLLLPSPSYSEEIAVSQIRAPNQSWEEALSRNMDTWGESVLAPEVSLLQNTSVKALDAIPEWKMGLFGLNAFVIQSTNTRIYSNPNPGDYKRKAPWLYPIDGCYAKAAHISAQAAAREFPRPGKVFAFGHLRYNTPYAKRGRVWWSYHVAAAYRINGTVYVIDPMMNGSSAMPLNEWLSSISDKPETVRVKLCDANAYSPSNRCIGSRNNGAYLGHIRYVLSREYSNLKSIGVNPSKVLAP